MAIYTQQLQQLYVAYFGRPADVAGLAFWEAVTARAGGNTSQVSAAFAASDEFQATYAGMSTKQVINKLYMNLFGHQADPMALSYWSANLESGRFTIDEALDQIVPRSNSKDRVILDLKVKAAVAFTDALDTEFEVDAFSSPGGLHGGKLYIESVVSATALAHAIQHIKDYFFYPERELTLGEDRVIAHIIHANPHKVTSGEWGNTLQTNDRLTGTDALDDELNLHWVTGGAAVPIIKDIELVNVDNQSSGSTILSFENSAGVKHLNITSVIESNTLFSVANLNEEATMLSLSNATGNGAVAFGYRDHLKGNQPARDVATLDLSNIRLSVLAIRHSHYGFGEFTVNVNGASEIGSFMLEANRVEPEADSSSQRLSLIVNDDLAINELSAPGAEQIFLHANADIHLSGWMQTDELNTLTVSGAANVTIDGSKGLEARRLDVIGDTMTGKLVLGLSQDHGGGDKVSVKSGAGDDTIIVYGGLKGTIETNAGNDSVQVDGEMRSDIGDLAITTIRTGAGNDIVSVRSAGGGIAWDGGALIDTGDGDDSVTAIEVGESAKLMTGAGKDHVTTGNVGGQIWLGDGDDVLTFEPLGFADVLIGDGTIVDGGAGVNVMNVSANHNITVANPDAQISGIQILNLNSVSGTIDVDVSRFDSRLTSITLAGDDQTGAYGNFNLTNLRPNLAVKLAAPVLYLHLQTDDGAIQLKIEQEGRDSDAGTISVIATPAMQALLTTGTVDLSGINGGEALTGIDTLHVADDLKLTKGQLEGFSGIVLDGNVAHHLTIYDSQALQQAALIAAHVFITNAGPETSFTIGDGVEMNLAQFLAAGYVDGVLIAGDLAQLVGQPDGSSEAAGLAHA